MRPAFEIWPSRRARSGASTRRLVRLCADTRTPIVIPRGEAQGAVNGGQPTRSPHPTHTPPSSHHRAPRRQCALVLTCLPCARTLGRRTASSVLSVKDAPPSTGCASEQQPPPPGMMRHCARVSVVARAPPEKLPMYSRLFLREGRRSSPLVLLPSTPFQAPSLRVLKSLAHTHTHTHTHKHTTHPLPIATPPSPNQVKAGTRRGTA
jgi:hypothetical protein